MSKKPNLLLSFFSSVRLTIVLLILIVLVFIAGTFLPQQGATPESIGQLSPAAAKTFFFLRWTDLYHSPLFYALLGLLSLNLIICSIKRFPLSLRQYRASSFPEPAGIFEHLPQNRIIIADKEKEQAGSIIESCLQEKYKTVGTADTETGRLFYGERGRFSIFGVYAVHLSILLMIAGAVIGSLFGLAADVNMKEGETINSVQIAGGKGIRELDFSVRCDKFIVELYDNGSPKTYRSDLSFIQNGRVKHQGSVLVNHPITFAGLRFYQSSYRVAPEAKAVLTYTIAGQKSAGIILAQGDVFALPQQNAQVHVLRVEENILELGPAVRLRVTAPQKDIQFWVFQHIGKIAAANPGLLSSVPVFNPGLFKPVVFSLDRMEQQYFTGLHIVRDPGIPLVALSGMLMLAGLLIIFFLPHRRVWVRMEDAPEKILIYVAGRSNRNNAGLERQLDHLCGRIKERLIS